MHNIQNNSFNNVKGFLKKRKNNVEGNRPFEMKDNDEEVRKKNYRDQRNFGKRLEKEIKIKHENSKKL